MQRSFLTRWIMLFVSLAASMFAKPAQSSPPANPSSQGNLTGRWIATGYYCTPTPAPAEEILDISQQGTAITATKVKGDTCIGDGEVTWTGTITGTSFPAQMQVLNIGTNTHSWLPGTATLVSPDAITLSQGISLRRQQACPTPTEPLPSSLSAEQAFKLITDQPTCREPIIQSSCNTLKGVETASLAETAPIVAPVFITALTILYYETYGKSIPGALTIGRALAITEEGCMPHRGRFQAQGGGLEASFKWAQLRPLSAAGCLAGMLELKNKISRRQLQERADSFRLAEAKIEQFIKAGGYHVPLSGEFKRPFPPGRQIRVDIEVRAGSACVP